MERASYSERAEPFNAELESQGGETCDYTDDKSLEKWQVQSFGLIGFFRS